MADIVVNKDPKNQVPAPPLTTALIDSSGNVSRAWAIFFRELYNRTSYKGGNAIDNNITTLEELIDQVELNISAIQSNAEAIQVNSDNIQTNAENIQTNADNIAQNSADIVQNALGIAQNAINIQANVDAILFLSNALSDHVNAFEAHGSNGDIVGFNDLADESTVGLVLKMTEVSGAVATTVNIVTADLGAAPATYDQTYTQSAADLTNENKAAINQLATDLNAAITVLNNLIAASKAAGQMTTP